LYLNIPGLNITSEGLKDIINKVVDERTKAFMAPFNHIWTESIVSTQEDKGFRKTLIHDNGLKVSGVQFLRFSSVDSVEENILNVR